MHTVAQLCLFLLVVATYLPPVSSLTSPTTDSAVAMSVPKEYHDEGQSIPVSTVTTKSTSEQRRSRKLRKSAVATHDVTTDSNRTLHIAANVNLTSLASSRDLMMLSDLNSQRGGSSTPTTLYLIVVLHLIFFYQWNGRRSRRRVLTSYHVLVQKKQFYRGWIAMLSHPPVDPHMHPRNLQQQTTTQSQSSTRSYESRSQTETIPTNATGNDSHNSLLTPAMAQWLSDLAYPLTKGHLSGFPLLFYNSHLLWSSRALEVYYNNRDRYDAFASQHTNDNSTALKDVMYEWEDVLSEDIQMAGPSAPFQYARVLLALTVLALLLELRLSSLLLGLLKPTADSEEPPTLFGSSEDNLSGNGTSSANNTPNQMQVSIMQRPIGTLTVLTCGITIVFHHHFEFVPLQVLPFLANHWLVLGFFSFPASWTLFFCLGILATLSFPSHPLTSVLYGAISGLLWSFGWTSFLQEPWWGNSLLVALLLLSFLSMKASGTRSTSNSSCARTWICPAVAWVPCIDFVSWNHLGMRVRSGTGEDQSTPTAGTAVSTQSFGERDDEDGGVFASFDDDDFSSDDDSYFSHIETQPLLSDNGEGDIEMPSVDERGRTVRSRRGGNTSATTTG